MPLRMSAEIACQPGESFKTGRTRTNRLLPWWWPCFRDSLKISSDDRLPSKGVGSANGYVGSVGCRKGLEVPALRELDASASPLAFFGSELRLARLAAGLSQEQLGKRLGFSGDLVGKIETGDRRPNRDFVAACDESFPAANGLFGRIYDLARRSGGVPAWFQEWYEAERQALSVSWWEPMLVPGLVQTADYARALFQAWRSADSDDELDQLVSARMARQAILDRPKPPMLWIVIDEAVLHRCIGSPRITHDQLEHLADLAERPKITVQVVPGAVGAHVGLLGAFAIATFDHEPAIVYMESPDQGQTTDRHATVTKVSLTFDTLSAEALPRGASREIILKVAEERWT
jgi:transcriptional regulator with XRE-family HTH domain